MEILGFSATNILREINFEDSRISKAGNFAVFEVLNFVNLVELGFEKLPKIMKILTSRIALNLK